MSGTAGGKRNQARINPRLLPAIDQLLMAGIKLGPAKKHEAINKILQLVPKWTRGDCWQRIRQLRRTSELGDVAQAGLRDGRGRSADAAAVQRPPNRPWTAEDDEKLLNWSGYEPVKKIAQRLSRSVRAVRFRLGALGISARVSDGWSQRSLRKLLRVSPARLRQLIGSGKLRPRDARITRASLAAFRDDNWPSIKLSAIQTITSTATNGNNAYSWQRAANILGVTVGQVQSFIARGRLKVVDTFVTDRSFEEFCKMYGGEINMALIDPATAKWLASEYGVQESASPLTISRAQKHALVVGECNCGRKIAGNVYFKHVKYCRVEAVHTMGKAVQDGDPRSQPPRRCYLGGNSTYASASLRQSSNDG